MKIMAAGYFSRPEDKFDNSYTPLRYKLCCVFFTGMLCFLVILLSTSLAAYTGWDGYEAAKDEGTIGYNVASLFCFLFGFMADSLLEIGISIGNMVQLDFSGVGLTGLTSAIKGFDNVFNNTLNVMKTIGFALCLFFFIMTLIDLLTSERLSFEIFWKHFLKLILGAFMVDNAEKVKEFVIEFGNAFMTDVNTGLSSNNNIVNPFTETDGTFLQALVEFAETMPLGWMMLLGIAFLVGIFCLLIGLIINGAAILIAFSRFLELYLRCTFLPVALALMTDDGWRGAGGRYIKKIIAVSVQGVALIIIGSLVGSAVGSIFSSLATVEAKLTIGSLLNMCLSTIVVSLGFGLAGLSLMFKSIGIVNDVFGV